MLKTRTLMFDVFFVLFCLFSHSKKIVLLAVMGLKRCGSESARQRLFSKRVTSPMGKKGDAPQKLTWDQALFFVFFTSLFLWLEREENNAWYIHLTSHQPPPILHYLTSAWHVMLLANQRLPARNQTLAGIMSLSRSILGMDGTAWINYLKSEPVCRFCNL